jgi:hypothetical protein
MRADAAAVLRRCQMPPVEIGWVLTADDQATVHMLLELHRERLEEELSERQRALREVESWLKDDEPDTAFGRDPSDQYPAVLPKSIGMHAPVIGAASGDAR